MKVKSFRNMSSLIILFMLTSLIFYVSASSYKYAFSYQNEDVIYHGNQDSISYD